MPNAKQKILEAAQALYAEHGYGGLSMRRVAKLAGLSTMASYRHFQNKDDLLHHVQVHAFAVYTEHYARPLLDINDPWVALRRSFSAYRQFAQDHPSYFRIAFMATDGVRDLREHTADGLRVIEAAFEVPLHIMAAITGSEQALAETLRAWAFSHGLIALHISGRLDATGLDFDALYRGEMDRYVRDLRRNLEGDSAAQVAGAPRR